MSRITCAPRPVKSRCDWKSSESYRMNNDEHKRTIIKCLIKSQKYGHSSCRVLFIRRTVKMSIISAFLTIFGSIEARPSWPNVKMLENGQNQNKSTNQRKVLKKSSLSYCQLLKLKFPSLQWSKIQSNSCYADLWKPQ